MPKNTTLQILRTPTKENLPTTTPLADGELLYDKATNRLFIGTETTLGSAKEISALPTDGDNITANQITAKSTLTACNGFSATNGTIKIGSSTNNTIKLTNASFTTATVTNAKITTVTATNANIKKVEVGFPTATTEYLLLDPYGSETGQLKINEASIIGALDASDIYSVSVNASNSDFTNATITNASIANATISYLNIPAQSDIGNIIANIGNIQITSSNASFQNITVGGSAVATSGYVAKATSAGSGGQINYIKIGSSTYTLPRVSTTTTSGTIIYNLNINGTNYSLPQGGGTAGVTSIGGKAGAIGTSTDIKVNSSNNLYLSSVTNVDINCPTGTATFETINATTVKVEGNVYLNSAQDIFNIGDSTDSAQAAISWGQSSPQLAQDNDAGLYIKNVNATNVNANTVNANTVNATTANITKFRWARIKFTSSVATNTFNATYSNTIQSATYTNSGTNTVTIKLKLKTDAFIPIDEGSYPRDLTIQIPGTDTMISCTTQLTYNSTENEIRFSIFSNDGLRFPNGDFELFAKL